jgi:hypothetical protein
MNGNEDGFHLISELIPATRSLPLKHAAQKRKPVLSDSLRSQRNGAQARSDQANRVIIKDLWAEMWNFKPRPDAPRCASMVRKPPMTINQP